MNPVDSAYEDARNAGLIRNGTHVIVPTTPPRALLVSMAMRLYHDFGIDAVSSVIPSGETVWSALGWTPEARESVLTDMVRLYEEVAGEGFYKWGAGEGQRDGLYKL